MTSINFIIVKFQRTLFLFESDVFNFKTSVCIFPIENALMLISLREIGTDFLFKFVLKILHFSYNRLFFRIRKLKNNSLPLFRKQNSASFDINISHVAQKMAGYII